MAWGASLLRLPDSMGSLIGWMLIIAALVCGAIWLFNR